LDTVTVGEALLSSLSPVVNLICLVFVKVNFMSVFISIDEKRATAKLSFFSSQQDSFASSD